MPASTSGPSAPNVSLPELSATVGPSLATIGDGFPHATVIQITPSPAATLHFMRGLYRYQANVSLAAFHPRLARRVQQNAAPILKSREALERSHRGRERSRRRRDVRHGGRAAWRPDRCHACGPTDDAPGGFTASTYRALYASEWTDRRAVAVRGDAAGARSARCRCRSIRRSVRHGGRIPYRRSEPSTWTEVNPVAPTERSSASPVSSRARLRDLAGPRPDRPAPSEGAASPARASFRSRQRRDSA